MLTADFIRALITDAQKREDPYLQRNYLRDIRDTVIELAESVQAINPAEYGELTGAVNEAIRTINDHIITR